MNTPDPRLVAATGLRAGGAVLPGVEVLFERHPELLRGKRVGLITNPTGIDRGLGSIVAQFQRHPEIKLVALYGPEHGIRGDAQAGEYVAFYQDAHFQLPVFSLYGQSMKPPPGMLQNIDEYMRTFDTTAQDKAPASTMLETIDTMVCDLQDIGTRVYTFVATMAYAMQACAESDIAFVVLDRPNPINGVDMEGPILEYPKHSSFVGLYPVPLRHGMTSGELATLFNERFFNRKVRLTVVPMEGWTREQWFDDTRLPWVAPSPNMPTLATATVYPGQVLLEGTNLSEGRGTTQPFELFGAPWIDGFDFTRRLNALGLPGVVFREAWFTPTFSKHQGQRCGGCQVHVTDRNVFRSVATTLLMLQEVIRAYPGKLEFHADYFDKVMGISAVRLALESGADVAPVIAGFQAGIDEFARMREQYLLYRNAR
ncbi:MAG: DUF1343 domain-containing protein [Opitutae bacterium]|nr:DUF1343 domain-containing protein [Opitutae bacterium]